VGSLALTQRKQETAVVTITGDKVEFLFFRPHAHRVCLIGDFNAWRENELIMRQQGRWWRATLFLPDGKYRFRYLADGTPYCDYAAFGVEAGPHGFDSVLCVDSGMPTHRTCPLLDGGACVRRGGTTASGGWSRPPRDQLARRRERPAIPGMNSAAAQSQCK